MQLSHTVTSYYLPPHRLPRFLLNLEKRPEYLSSKGIVSDPGPEERVDH